MSDEHELREPLVDAADDRGGDRIQESVFGDVAGAVAAFTSAGGLGVGVAQYRLDRYDGLGVVDDFSGFGVEGDYIDLADDDWFGAE